MTPARAILAWLTRADRRDAGLAFAGMAGLGFWLTSAFEALLFGLLGAVALIIVRIDSRHHLIPDLLVLTLAISGLLRLLVTAAPLMPPLATACGVLLALMLLRHAASRSLGKPALGAGDVKLMAAAALWLEPAQMPTYILAAALSGLTESLILGRRRLAFGRHLAPWLCVFVLIGPGLAL